MSAAQEAGLSVPDDLAVVGFDDIAFARLAHPSLTTIAQPVDRLGRGAMEMVLTLKPAEIVQERPFTNPDRIDRDVNTLRFMVDQLCVFMEDHYSDANLQSPIIVHRPHRDNWFYRQVIARPAVLSQSGNLAFVGFLGHRRADANLTLGDEFDETLVNEIPDYAGLLSYSTMALVSGDFSNLVVFTKPSIKEQWSNSKAHDQAVRKLAPDYYWSIKLYNGKLPNGITDSRALQLTRIKYYDYQVNPRWHAVREFPEG